MTVGECFEKIRKLLNYYSAAGAEIPEDDGARTDLYARSVALMDAAQHELAAVHPPLRTAVLEAYRVKNLLPPLATVRLGDEPVSFEASGARACAFTTAGALTAAVTQVRDGERVTLATVETSSGPGQRGYTATFAAQADTPVRITFTGGPAYITGVALYGESFASVGEVPVYGVYRFYPLPGDFYSMRRVNLVSRLGERQGDLRDYRLADGALGLPWDFDGTAEVIYAALPAAVDGETPLDTEFSIDERAAQGIAYYAAAQLCAAENPGLSDRFLAAYRDILLNLTPTADAGSIRSGLFTADACTGTLLRGRRRVL